MERYSTAEATAASAALGKSKPREKALNMENVNPQVKAAEYAVRGPIVIKAAEIERLLQQVRDTSGFFGTLSPFFHVTGLPVLPWPCDCIRKGRRSPRRVCVLHVFN